ncbi:hypothetical protein R4795_15035 [Acinetobacter baumannii]|nr:hypothetical protein [Acinetobacter baumannii]
MIEVKTAVQFDGDDVWLGSVLISKCGDDERWTAYLDNDAEKEFESLEHAVTYCLEQAND